MISAVLIRPLLTEKTLSLASRGWYTFVVDLDSSKQAVAVAIEKQYKVTVVTVRSIHMTGKERRVGKQGRHIRKQDWKKAMVRLGKGQKIQAFEVTQEAPTSA